MPLKVLFFLECLYFSEYDIGMLLFVFWLRNRPSIKYVSNLDNGEGIIQSVYRCVQGRGVEISHKIRTN